LLVRPRTICRWSWYSASPRFDAQFCDTAGRATPHHRLECLVSCAFLSCLVPKIVASESEDQASRPYTAVACPILMGSWCNRRSLTVSSIAKRAFESASLALAYRGSPCVAFRSGNHDLGQYRTWRV
jgi:hypothetical protein